MTRSFSERARGVLRRYWLRYRYEWSEPRLSVAELRARLAPGFGADLGGPGSFAGLMAAHMASTPRALWEAGGEVADDGFLERARRGECEILKRTFTVTPATDWLRDPFNGVSWPRRQVESCPYRVAGSDLVLLWHLNKMVFLIDRAAAWRATGDQAFARDTHALMRSWCDANPWLVGPNWISPMDAGTRLVAWSMALAGVAGGPAPDDADSERIIRTVQRHAEFVAGHFSAWTIPNNHLIGEAATLSAFAAYWPLWKDAPAWSARAEEILREEARRQVLKDGLQFESSYNYHLYALDYFLLHLHAKLIRGETPDEIIVERTAEMADAALALIAPSGRMPMIGDDSMTRGFVLGSMADLPGPLAHEIALADLLRPAHTRLFETTPWGRDLVRVRAPLARSRRFHEAGFDVARDADSHLVFTHGPQHHRLFSHGHLHADAGSFELELGGVPVVIDSGTGIYGCSRAERDHMRGTKAHNTVTVDGVEPMLPLDTFQWAAIAAGEALGFGHEDDVTAVGCRRRIPGAGGAAFEHVRALVRIGATVIVADTLHARDGGAAGAAQYAEARFHTPVTPGAAVLEGARVRLTDASRFVRVFEVLGDEGARVDLLDPDDAASKYSPWYGEIRRGVTIRASIDVDRPVTLLSVFRDPDVTVERLGARPGEIACAVVSGHRRRVLTVKLDPFTVRAGGRTIVGHAAAAAPAPSGSMDWLDEIESQAP